MQDGDADFAGGVDCGGGKGGTRVSERGFGGEGGEGERGEKWGMGKEEGGEEENILFG